MDDTISRQAAIDAMCELMHHWFGGDPKDEIREIKRELEKLPSAQSEPYKEKLKEIADALSEKFAYMHTCLNERDIILGYLGVKHSNEIHCNTDCTYTKCESYHFNKRLPDAQPEKEKAKRVLWTGWKGYRDTRYKCPNCKKPVKNDDIYCHRCGQRLMFPHISFTDYIPGEKQETIVRWDDE